MPDTESCVTNSLGIFRDSSVCITEYSGQNNEIFLFVIAVNILCSSWRNLLNFKYRVLQFRFFPAYKITVGIVIIFRSRIVNASDSLQYYDNGLLKQETIKSQEFVSGLIPIKEPEYTSYL